MNLDTEINITDNLAQQFVEQGLTTKESEILSFIITKCDDTIMDIVETFEERETTKVVYALFYWIVLLINRKQEKDFDTKYRETRKK
jgi:hypothetical protein